MIDINEMLKFVVDCDAEDLHIRVNHPPLMRHHGSFSQLDTHILTSDDTDHMMKEITPPRFV